MQITSRHVKHETGADTEADEPQGIVEEGVEEEGDEEKCGAHEKPNVEDPAGEAPEPPSADDVAAAMG